ncbi:MAG: cysteine desulfurase [Planctomycetota bacterium]|nr:cysteine desulfurase [Planctomycetota bacterium]
MSTLEEVRASSPVAPIDVERVRADFPLLERSVHGKPLVYLDNAASAQKPRVVLERLQRFYTEINSNVHRGVHALSQAATEAYEGARETVRRFLNAGDVSEIVFVRGATEAINLVASSFGRQHVGAGDEVLITTMEHHSNIVPWQLLCESVGAHLTVVPVTDSGQLDLEAYGNLLTERTKLVALVHVSNTLGTVNPVKGMVALAHERDIPVLLDGAQAVPHMKVDLQELDCDFYALSSHKAFGPMGTGVLYGKHKWLESMPPYQGGGEMILSVQLDKSTFREPPGKFEAGTPSVAAAVGFAAALEYLEGFGGFDGIIAHETSLLARATHGLQQIGGVRLFGTSTCKAAVLSFVTDWAHPHDLGTFLDQEGIAVRTGHHCTQPLMKRFGVPATTRASFAFYNSLEEVDTFVRALEASREFFGA